jgi:hypothetical protein
MTALSTALAVVVTPFLTLLLLGRRLPIDLYGMIINITEIHPKKEKYDNGKFGCHCKCSMGLVPLIA